VEHHPVRLVVDDDLRRSRLTVLFRGLLAAPHGAWGLVWGLLLCATVPFAWLVAVVSGRLWPELHDLHARYLRWLTHVAAYLFLIANPYPRLSGRPGYPVDVAVEPPARQPRLVTAFRTALALPAVVFASVLGSLLVACALLALLTSLVLGRIPRGLRDVEAYCLHFVLQTLAYALLLTARYPTLSYEPLTAEAAASPTPS
jgi:Domain of unknown function (DUF4389)